MAQTSPKTAPVNLLVTLDENYISQLNVMLYSLLKSNPGEQFRVYLLHTNIRENKLARTRQLLGDRHLLIPIQAKGIDLKHAPTSARYPREIYYRIFAARYLPEDIDRILYLDPDIIVNGPVRTLYDIPMEKYFFAAATHVEGIFRLFNELRLKLDKDCPYINSGVILMNLERLRKEQDYEEVFDFIKKKKYLLFLPDQDIISCLYVKKIFVLDPFRYNMSERLYFRHSPFEKNLNLDWVRRHCVIIHYCGRNKPWKRVYLGQLREFYQEAVSGYERAFPAADVSR